MSNYVAPLPSLPEQRAIAAFLDRETDRIDALIGHKERLIALLEEKRQAVISHAVTRGLDPNVPMKDSGVSWLGMVPKHWEIKRLKYSVQFLNYRRIPLSSEERGALEKIYPYYGASGIIDQVDRYLFDEPLILIGEDGANLLSRSTPLAFVAIGKYWVNNHAHILKPKSGQLVYWTERLNSINYEPFVSGSAQPKLTIDALGSIEFATPDTQEQVKIAKYVEYQDAKLAPVINRVRDGIARLQEYRTALISAAVTGQIDVRDEVTP
ncbi:restriction endonuclease subunit S [Zavarzinella formosa]|uniref:restriction endonuclease subunit S n=1 Tax=Zavarzinella formosa TaxID=360055 RepID=UPI0012F969AE|nr:restriction endonuclease subunit S [Zavarzinella formosa]